MKKIFPILIILFIMALAFQVVLNVFIKHHNVKYSINSNGNSYLIEEDFVSKDNYDFIIKDKNNNIYNYNFKHNYNKQDRIIKDIKTYTSNKITCIVPICKRNLFDNIYCNYNNKVYSYSYLKENKIDINKITNSIKKDGYYKNTLNETNKIKKNESNNYYIGNIPDNYKFVVWNYTGLDIINNKSVEEATIFEGKDLYDNDYSSIAGDYYIILEKSSTNELVAYNIKDSGKANIYSDDTLSGEYNILGSYKNKLYLVDLDKYIEYSIDPYSRKVEKIGEESTGYKGFENGKLIDVSTSDFKSNIDKYKVNALIQDDTITSKFNATNIFKVDKYYYFKDKNNNFYRSNTKYKTNPTLLFRLNEVSDWKVIDNNILVISDNLLYFYNDEYGLKKVMLNNEFRYRYKNMYGLWHE